MKKIFSLLFAVFAAMIAAGQSTDAQLTTQSNVIRDETVPGANSKTRIAAMYQALIDSKLNHAGALTASGTDTYTLTHNSTITSYRTGLLLAVIFTNANTSVATLNVNSLGAKSIKKSGSTALSGNDIKAGGGYWLIYDGTNFQLMGGIGSGTSTVSVDGVTITGDGSPGNPLVAATSSGADLTLSNLSNYVTARSNLGALASAYTITTKSSGFTPDDADFVGLSPFYSCSGSFTVTLPSDATEPISVGRVFFGVTPSGSTTTFANGSGASSTTSSGGYTVTPATGADYFLWSVVKTASNTWRVVNGTPTVSSQFAVTFSGATVTYTNMPSGVQEIQAASARFRTKADLTNYTQMRVTVGCSVAGATGAGFLVQYSTDDVNFTTIGSGSGTDTAQTVVSTGVSNWITLPAGAKADVILRAASANGDGVADPICGAIIAYFR